MYFIANGGALCHGLQHQTNKTVQLDASITLPRILPCFASLTWIFYIQDFTREGAHLLLVTPVQTERHKMPFNFMSDTRRMLGIALELCCHD